MVDSKGLMGLAGNEGPLGFGGRRHGVLRANGPGGENSWGGWGMGDTVEKIWRWL